MGAAARGCGMLQHAETLVVGLIDSFDGPLFSQERYGTAVVRMRFVLEPSCVPQRRAFDDFIQPLIMSREFHTHPEVGATLHQESRHR